MLAYLANDSVNTIIHFTFRCEKSIMYLSRSPTAGHLYRALGSILSSGQNAKSTKTESLQEHDYQHMFYILVFNEALELHRGSTPKYCQVHTGLPTEFLKAPLPPGYPELMYNRVWKISVDFNSLVQISF